MHSLRILAAVGLAAATLSASAGENTTPVLRNKIAQCQGCHGIDGWKTAFPEVYHVPKLGGQKPEYIVAALKEYKDGDRDFATMHEMAADLTDQDMQDLAKYFGGEPASGATPPAEAK